MPATIVVNQVVTAAFLVLVLTAAITDFRSYRIPNPVAVAIILLFPVFAVTSPADVDWLAALLIAGGVLAAGIVMFAFRQLGGGDVKLLVGCALWAGPAHAMNFLLVTGLAGGVLAVLMISPLGRGLAVAADIRGLARFRDFLMADVVPYGVAIAAGGIFVAVNLMAR
jgi:prepilin peptidase CpaA